MGHIPSLLPSSSFLLLGSTDSQPFAWNCLCQRRWSKCKVSRPPTANLASKPHPALCPPYVGPKTQLLCFQGPTKQEKAQQGKVLQVCVSKMLGQEAGHAVLQHDYRHQSYTPLTRGWIYDPNWHVNSGAHGTCIHTPPLPPHQTVLVVEGKEHI